MALSPSPAPIPVLARPRSYMKQRFGKMSRRLSRAVAQGFASSLTRRISLLSLAGLLVMLVGFLWINQTRESVIDARMQSLNIQGEIIAAAVAASATIETDSITVDPDKLLQLQEGETLNLEEDDKNSLEFSINPERVAPVLRRLTLPTRNRARLYDREGTLLLDTAALSSQGNIQRYDLPPPEEDEAHPLFERNWNALKRRFGRLDLPRYVEPPKGSLPNEITNALAGNSTALVRVNADGQTVVSVTLPVQRLRGVRGVLNLTTQEGDIDRVIAEERLSIIYLFVIASAVMLVLSFLLANTIAGPVRKLSEAAERVRRGIRQRAQIPDFRDRPDEIGHLSGALHDMTQSLYNRIEAIERFAADVSHELKNPLTSLRSAVETLPLAKQESAKARLLEVIQHDVKRLDRLITDISEASRLDAELQRAEIHPVDLCALLETVVNMANDVRREGQVAILLALPETQYARHKMIIEGHDSRLVQVLDNLIENARSFSPASSTVRVNAQVLGQKVEISVEDDGPGIPEHALQKIFERFYTDRPQQGFGQNSGLGLSISKQIIEAHHGTIRAENRKDGDGKILGARFIITLPIAG